MISLYLDTILRVKLLLNGQELLFLNFTTFSKL